MMKSMLQVDVMVVLASCQPPCDFFLVLDRKPGFHCTSVHFTEICTDASCIRSFCRLLCCNNWTCIWALPSLIPSIFESHEGILFNEFGNMW